MDAETDAEMTVVFGSSCFFSSAAATASAADADRTADADANLNFPSVFNHRKCQKAHSGIVSGRQGLGKPGLWLVAIAKKE